MPEIILPCPNCQTNLLVDEGNAGLDVLCPGCEVRLRLPQDLSGRTLPVMAGGMKAPAPAAPAAETAEQEEARRNFPLHRTGHLVPVPEGESPAAHRATQLPSRGRRDLDAPEEMRRLASMAAAPATFDLHNVDTKGRIAFPCPGCQRPVWMVPGDAGQLLECPGCARGVIAPDPVHQQPARLADEGEAASPRQKTVLPAKRQVENLPLGEQAAAGRPKRQGNQLPATRESIRGPVPLEERAHTPAPGQEPIPARGDVELSATVHRGPAAPRRGPVLTEAQERASVAAEFEANSPTPAVEPGPPGARHFQKSSGDRLPSFSPRHEMDVSAETTGNWGSDGKPENTASFRRTLTTAIVVLLVGGIGIATYFLKNTWSHQDQTVEKKKAENPVAGVDGAKATIRGFFAAKTPEEMAKFVRFPETALPRLQKYYSEPARIRLREGFTTDWFTEDWREVDDYLGSRIDFIVTSLQPKGEPEITAMLEVPKDGSQPLLDWEHFVAWSETKWEDFLRTTSDRATEFRVSVTQIDYYNFAYSDRSRYLAFRVADPRNSAHCYAYCEARSKLGNLLLDSIRKGRQAGLADPATGEGIARVILRLKFLPEGKANNQAVIDALVWDDWLRPNGPADR